MKKMILILGLVWAAGAISAEAAKDTSRLAQVKTRQITLIQASFKNGGTLTPAKRKQLDVLNKKVGDEMQKISTEAYKDMNSGNMSKMKDITPEKQKYLNQLMDQEFQLLGVDPKTTYK